MAESCHKQFILSVNWQAWLLLDTLHLLIGSFKRSISSWWKAHCVFYLPGNYCGVGTPEDFSWEHIKQKKEKIPWKYPLKQQSSKVLQQGQMWESVRLTSGWFYLRVKRLHVVNVDVTSSVCCVQQHVLVCFSQFCYLLVKVRLSIKKEKKRVII